MKDEYPQFIAEVGAMAMGSTTYEWIADHTGFLDDPSKWEYTIPTWVFSSRDLPRPEGPDIRFVTGDVRPVHAEMVAAADGRNVWLVGGGELVGQFYDHGLLDEVIIGVAPVFLGSGAPLLPRRITAPAAEADRCDPVRRDLRHPALRGVARRLARRSPRPTEIVADRRGEYPRKICTMLRTGGNPVQSARNRQPTFRPFMACSPR